MSRPQRVLVHPTLVQYFNTRSSSIPLTPHSAHLNVSRLWHAPLCVHSEHTMGSSHSIRCQLICCCMGSLCFAEVPAVAKCVVDLAESHLAVANRLHQTVKNSPLCPWQWCPTWAGSKADLKGECRHGTVLMETMDVGQFRGSGVFEFEKTCAF